MLFFPKKYRELFPYQKATLETMLESNDPRFSIFWEMRLGKTLLSIRYAKEKKFKRVLVVCPLSVIDVWKRELLSEDLPSFIFTRSNPESVLNYKDIPIFWAITNYEHLRSGNSDLIFDDPEDSFWDCVILDESPKIRNPNTQVSTVCCAAFKRVPSKLILTGSPTPNSLLDYFQQKKFLYNEFMGAKNWDEFKDSYFNCYGTREILLRFQHKEEFEKAVHYNTYRLKRRDVNVGSEKIYEPRYIELPEKLEEIYNSFESSWQIQEEGGDTIETKWAFVAQNYLHQICGGYPKKITSISSDHKMKEIFSLIRGELKDEKIVIWCNLRREQENIVKELRQKDHYAVAINGDTREADRKYYVNRFNTGDINYLVCTFGTIDHGVDLSGADTAIYYSNKWSRNLRLQSEDRIIHPTKKHPMLYIDLVVKDKVDEFILSAFNTRHIRTEIFEQTVYLQYLKSKESQTKKVG